MMATPSHWIAKEQMVSLLNEVIQGTIELPARDQEGTMRNRKILFKDNIGNSYPLKEVATGIKSLSLLQSLLTKGRLNDKTLLIIDGTRKFICTHNG